MASEAERSHPRTAERRIAIPRQRDATEHQRVVADDLLIDAIGAGSIHEVDGDPVVRLLAQWRAQVLATGRTGPCRGRRSREAGA